MNLNKTDKTLIVCLTFILGIASVFLDLIPVFSVLLIISIIYFLYNKTVSFKFITICLLVFALSVFYTNYKIPKFDELAYISPIYTSLKGRVLTQPKDNLEYKTKFELEAYSFKDKNSNWKPIKSKTLVNIYDKKRKFKNINIGDTVEVTGSVRLPYKATNPGQFDYAKYLKNSRIFTNIFVGHKNFKVIGHPESGKWFLIQKLNKIKNQIISIHKQNLKSPKLEVLGGIVFGDYAVPTPKYIKQNFVNSGLLHLLAASGMNVALIFGIWAFLAKKIFIPYSIRIIAGMTIVALYALLTGLPPSVTRATWMLEFILLGKLINRQADNIALLALVCAIMLIFDPLIITDIGFQLSFIVTFGLLICTPLFVEKLKPIPAAISGMILIPMIAQLWVAPIQLFHFNSFAIYSVIANILVIPFVGIISFLGFISSVFCLTPVIGEKICWLLDKCAEPLIGLLLYISKFISTLPGALHYFASPDIISIILFYVLILIIVIHIKLDYSKKRINFIILALILGISFISLKDCFSKDLKFMFFDVGEADSILIQTPDKHNILIDTGNIAQRGFNSANTIVIPYLRDMGIKKLDAIVLTHPDKDHIGGTIGILENIKVDQILDNGKTADSKIYKQLQAYIDKIKIPCKHLSDGENLNISKEVKIRIIKPEDTNRKTNNDTSIILHVKYNDFSALLMGDGEANAINLIKKYVKEPVNIIKIGHHGSYNSVNKDFIEYLKPKTAIISVGKNEYLHPHKHTLKLLDKYKVKTYRTDKDYAIEIKTNGKKIKINNYGA